MSAEHDVSIENAPPNEQPAAAGGPIPDQERTAAGQAGRLERLVADLQAQTSILRATIDGIADAVVVVDENGHFTHVNAAAEPFLRLSDDIPEGDDGWKAAAGIFRSDGITPYPPGEHPLVRALGGEVVDNEEVFVRMPNMTEGIWLHTSSRPVYTQDKLFRGAVVIFRDISERKRGEREMAQRLIREKERNDQLERMRLAIEQLSIPILEVWQDVLAVPVIGVVDSTRAAEMMERVLEAVERKQCRFLIIDITGVDVIDTGTADRFLKLITAAEILGARCLLTGARAVVAQTLASLGMDLKGVAALRTLRHALSECIRAMEPTAQRPQLGDSMLAARQSRA